MIFKVWAWNLECMKYSVGDIVKIMLYAILRRAMGLWGENSKTNKGVIFVLGVYV